MTCPHVLGLIDAGPLAGNPRAHYDVARRHAETCAGCGRAVAAAGQLVRGLTDWPDVAPPADLAVMVMARIARIDEARERDAGRSPALARREASGWSVWVAALGGLAACVALVWSAATGGAALIRVTGPGLGGVAMGGVTWPSTLPEGLLLAAGLALYAVGLFAPAAVRSRR